MILSTVRLYRVNCILHHSVQFSTKIQQPRSSIWKVRMNNSKNSDDDDDDDDDYDDDDYVDDDDDEEGEMTKRR